MIDADSGRGAPGSASRIGGVSAGDVRGGRPRRTCSASLGRRSRRVRKGVPMRLRLVLSVFILAALVAVPIAGSSAKKRRSAGAQPIYLNQSYSPAERAADLVSRMTLTEKASQMNSSQAPAIAA